MKRGCQNGKRTTAQAGSGGLASRGQQQRLTAFEDDELVAHSSSGVHPGGLEEIDDNYRSFTRSALAGPTVELHQGFGDGLDADRQQKLRSGEHVVQQRWPQEKQLVQQKSADALCPEEKIGTGNAQPIENNSFEPRKRGSGISNSMLTTRKTADSLGEKAYHPANEALTNWVLQKAQQEKKPQGGASPRSSQKASHHVPHRGAQSDESSGLKRELSSAKMLGLVEEINEAIRESNDIGRKNLGFKSTAREQSREILPSPELIARLMMKDILAPKLPEHYNRACSFVTKAPASAVFFITMNWLQAAAEAGKRQRGASEHFDVEYEQKLRDFKIRGTVFVNDSRAGWSIHIFQIGPNSELAAEYPRHRLVEIQRRDGDAFTFSTFYNKLACHLYHSSQTFQQKLSQRGNRNSDFYKMYSPWPEEGEFTIEQQFEPDWHGLPDMEQEYKNYGMLNLSRDPSCARIFIGMLKNDYAEIKSQGISSIAKAIRYPLNKAILMKPELKGDIMKETVKLLESSRDPLVVRSALVVIREAFRKPISLWEAAQHRRADVVEKLLSLDVNPDEMDPELRRTPLMYALEAGDLEIAEMLLSAHANVALRAGDGSRVRDYATSDGRDLLNKYSAETQDDTPMTEAPPIARKPEKLFSSKQRFSIVEKVVTNVLGNNRWVNPKNLERHPTSACVMTEAVMAIKEVIGIRENFPETIISVVTEPKLRDLLEQTKSLQGPFCEAFCSYCSACKEAYAERAEKHMRSQPRVSVTQLQACLLQPYQSSYNELHQLVDAVLATA